MTFTLRATTRRAVLGAGVAFTLAACGHSANSSSRDTGSAEGNVASTPSAANTLVRGRVVAVSDSALTVQSDSGTVHVTLEQPLQVYDRKPSTLDRVTANTFVGVTSVKQADGSDRATEIHIFPEALRGLGEGSRPMSQGASGAQGSMMTNGSTMTNGSMMTNGSTMTNGSMMSNGRVQRGAGPTIVVQYDGGSKTIVVPASTPVTELVAESAPLSVGEQVVVVATRGANGVLSSNRVLAAGK